MQLIIVTSALSRSTRTFYTRVMNFWLVVLTDNWTRKPDKATSPGSAESPSCAGQRDLPPFASFAEQGTKSPDSCPHTPLCSQFNSIILNSGTCTKSETDTVCRKVVFTYGDHFCSWWTRTLPIVCSNAILLTEQAFSCFSYIFLWIPNRWVCWVFRHQNLPH